MEVPKGKKVHQLPISHFKKLAVKKGFDSISKSLTALRVLHKNRNKGLSHWAEKMQKELSIWHSKQGRLTNPARKKRAKAVLKTEKSQVKTERFYKYRAYYYKVRRGEINEIKRTSIIIELKPTYDKKMVLSAMHYHGMIKPKTEGLKFNIKGDKYIFFVSYDGKPEFELRREDIF